MCVPESRPIGEREVKEKGKRERERGWEEGREGERSKRSFRERGDKPLATQDP